MTTEERANELAFFREPGLGAASLSHATPTPRRPIEFPRTDAGNAELFAHLYGDRLRFDHSRKRWLVWGGSHWSEDRDGTVMQLAIEAARQRYLDALLLPNLEERSVQSKFAVASESRQRLEASLALAKTEPPLSNAGADWDSDPWLLGVANGVIDLRTGQLLEGAPEQGITKHVSVRFDPDSDCPRFLQFLDEVCNGDAELIEFIWKAVGYSLTGDTSEQCVFACYGTGANGKSVLLRILRSVAGGYAYNAPFSLFELQNRSTIPNDVAPIAGARLVTSSETNEGTRLNEARLKALTGGDPITARYLYSENFTFYPQAKFWLAVNHRPRVHDQSFGFWRRLRLIPFLRTFGEDQDKSLDAKLQRELPGILAWAVRGCLRWQCEGLGAPTAVVEATETYRTDSDPLAAFLEECCIHQEGAQTRATDLYVAYTNWVARRSMKEVERLTSTSFGSKLGERFEKKRAGTGVVYVGLGLLSTHHTNGNNPAPVKGSVQGFESDEGFAESSSPVERVTREECELPYTTLNPTQQEAPS